MIEENSLNEEIEVKANTDELNCDSCIFKLIAPNGECKNECMGDECEENEFYEFIWGKMAADDFSSHEASLYTMNDIEIIRAKDSGKYFLSIEMIYGFEKEVGKYLYVRDLLYWLDEFMEENGYERKIPSFYKLFSTGSKDGFDTIEDLYIHYSYLFRGYLASFEEFHQDLIDEYEKSLKDEK